MTFNILQANRTISLPFEVDIGLNRIAGIRRDAYRGYITTCSSATVPNYIWDGGAFTWRTTQTAVEALSSSASDTGTYKVDGIDGNFIRLQENVTLNGTTPVALVNQYMHINQVTPVAVASGSGLNVGNVTFRVSGAGATMAYLPAGINISQKAMVWVPAGETLMIESQLMAYQSVVNPSDVQIQQEFIMPDKITRFRQQRLTVMNTGNNSFDMGFKLPLPIPEKTGYALIATACSTATAAPVSARIQGFYVQNSLL